MAAHPELSDTRHGVVLTVRVQPGAKRPGIAGLHGDACKVRVAAPAVDGRANLAVSELLADAFGIPVREVEIVSGTTSRTKRILLGGLTMAQAVTALEAHYT